jgi:quercetin dioxygenase-like cupin family protein
VIERTRNSIRRPPHWPSDYARLARPAHLPMLPTPGGLSQDPVGKYLHQPRRPTMPLNFRRVVTGHDADGHAFVQIDEIARNLVSARPGATAGVVWTTEGFPVDNNGNEDEGLRRTGTTLANGTVFRVLELMPGSSPRNHRTDSIDYAVVMSGEIDMELDATTVHLKAGDVLVQRGTIHNWVNRGTEPCVIAFVLIAANPVTAGGKVLHAQG